jgi:hypothetical protein
VRAPPVPPQRQRLATQAAQDPDRVCTTLAHLRDEDGLREASRQTRTARAAGSAGVTAHAEAAPLDHRSQLKDLPK